VQELRDAQRQADTGEADHVRAGGEDRAGVREKSFTTERHGGARRTHGGRLGLGVRSQGGTGSRRAGIDPCRLRSLHGSPSLTRVLRLPIFRRDSPSIRSARLCPSRLRRPRP
jgi:hypothetical protein